MPIKQLYDLYVLGHGKQMTGFLRGVPGFFFLFCNSNVLRWEITTLQFANDNLQDTKNTALFFAFSYLYLGAGKIIDLKKKKDHMKFFRAES